MLAATMGAMGPRALGGASAGPALLIRTFPFVDLMLRFTQGQHPTLRYLPNRTMKTVMELSDFSGKLERPEEKWAAQVAEVWSSSTDQGGVVASSLPDDPIESF